MTQTVQEFQQRMRSDRAFRKHIMAARKAGILAETLATEGFAFDPGLLDAHPPRVRTGLRGGQCYCMISPPKESNYE